MKVAAYFKVALITCVIRAIQQVGLAAGGVEGTCADDSNGR